MRRARRASAGSDRAVKDAGARGGRCAAGSERGDQDEGDEKQHGTEHRQPQGRRRLVGREHFLCRFVVMIVGRVVVRGAVVVFLSTHGRHAREPGGVRSRAGFVGTGSHALLRTIFTVLSRG